MLNRPIKPCELKNYPSIIPDFVFNAFNELITENYINGEAIFTRYDVTERIMKLNSTQEHYANEWLRVSPYYVRAGWAVDITRSPTTWKGLKQELYKFTSVS